jgi:hypothetical protein
MEKTLPKIDRASPLVFLTDKEKELSQELAQKRFDNKRKGDKRNHGYASGIKPDLEGVMAEIAVAKHLQVPIDESIHEAGDPGYDLVYEGCTLDIKHNQYRSNPHICFQNLSGFKSFKAHFCVLATTFKEAIEILGFISRLKFHKISQRRRFGRADLWSVHSNELQHIDFLDFAIEHFKKKGEPQ